jgi:serine/threonine protein kinase
VEIDDALEKFEHAWQTGKPPDLRSLIDELAQPLAPATARPKLICELLMIDFWHRWRNDAQSASAETASLNPSLTSQDDAWPRFPLLDDYAQRYADLLDWSDPPAELIGEEYRVRRWFGDHPTHDEYLHRFPAQSDRLPSVLARIDAQTSHRLNETQPLAPPAESSPKEKQAELTHIDKYRILTTLDQGGQGRVFRAMHPELRQELAIKLGHPVSGHSEQERHALIAEARALAQLDHPNLIRVHDLGFHDNCPYVVLDYVPGRNLRELTRSQRLSPQRAAEVVTKIARAVAVAHAHGINHLDLKPGNILIDQHGQPRLIDFGLARQRSAWTSPDDSKSRVAGTFLYMAPEQATGDMAQIGSRTDVYGLGAVLYDLLVGRPPRQGESAADIMNQAEEGIINAAALNATDIPPPLANICLKALAPDPQQRYDSAESLAAALESWDTRPPQPTHWPKFAAVTGAIAVGLLLLCSALLLNSGGRKTAEEKAARLVGHAPRRDFPLQFEIVGHPNESAVQLPDGQSIAVRLHSEVDCYVGIWHIDAAGATTLLFPSDREQDHFLRAGQSLTIPGQDDYSITVSHGDGAEYLWAVALTQPWDAEIGQRRGPSIALSEPAELLRTSERAANIVSRSTPRASERVIQLNVVPSP